MYKYIKISYPKIINAIKIREGINMNILESVILGLVQGLAEFIPISSSGHLILFSKLLGIEEPSFTYEVLLHVATLIPVLIIFRKELIDLLKNPFQKLTYYIIIATIPAVIAVLVLGDTIEVIFSEVKLLALGFIITGIILIYSDKVDSSKASKKSMNMIDALIIGIIQAIAIIPGISRSGSTIAGALSRKITREEAAKFSFLLSIPAILGAFVLAMIKIFLGKEVFVFDALPMSLGFIVASLSGYLAINFMLELIKRCKLKYFSYYVFVIAIFILVDKFFINKFF